MVLHRLAKDHTGGVCGYFSRGMMQSAVMATGVDLGPPVGCVGYCPLE